MTKYDVIKDERFGYYHLNPIPNEEEINKFYAELYYKKLKQSMKNKEAKLIV